MKTYREEAKIILLLALPILIAQASQTMITFVDTIMAGQYSALDLAGVALGSSIWLPCVLFGQGLLSVLTPIISQLNGSNQRDKIANQTRQGLFLATILSIILMLILYHSDRLIQLRHSEATPVDPEMMAIAVGYLRSMMWGVPAYLFFHVYRNQCEGLSNTKPAMIIGFLALLINIPFNYVFIYGKLGVPAFGGIGCGITAAMIYWLMFFAIKTYTMTAQNQRDIRKSIHQRFFDFKTIHYIFKLGLPMGLAFFFEVSLFALVSLLIAPLGKYVVASQQIVFAISSMTFTVPLSLAIATSIRVSFLLGERQLEQAKRVSYLSVLIGFIASLIIASNLVLFNTVFVSFFTNDANVFKLATVLIIFLAIYQCSDYVQVIASSVLRGYKDTSSIFIIAFTSYWLVGLPIGYTLALTDLIIPRLGVIGFWVGIIIGLTLAAILFLLRMRWIQRLPAAMILAKSGHKLAK